MRIAVVGTSNSLRKDGYVPRLEIDPRVSQLANYSIGASTSLLATMRTETVDFSQSDFCLIDFSVNEEVVWRNGGLDLDVTRELVENLVARCLAARCLPVITLLPRLMATDKAFMRPFYRTLARDLNLPIMDGYDLVDRLAAVGDIPKPAMFLDKAHIRPWVSAVFARTLADGLAGITPMDERFTGDPLSTRRFAAVDVSSQIPFFSKARRISRYSGRLSGEFIRSESPIKLSLRAQGADLIGILLNLRETNCYLRVKVKDDEVLMDVRSKYFESKTFRFVASALPVKRPLALSGANIDIWSLDEEGVTSFGPADGLQGELGRSKRPVTGHVEIAKLFVRQDGVFTSALSSAPANHVDFVASSDQGVIEFSAEMFRAISPPENDGVFELELQKLTAKKAARIQRTPLSGLAEAPDLSDPNRIDKARRIKHQEKRSLRRAEKGALVADDEPGAVRDPALMFGRG